MKWYEPEHIWDIYGINSRDEFVANYVVEGRFHKNVPEDISKSFVTVSYLLAHSYYHLPMFDEALSKVLLVMEMTVKLKAKILGIPIKNGKRDRRLADIINDVFKINQLSFLKADFDRAREIRNTKVHPNKHSFAGAMSFAASNARLFVNLINMLFLESNELNKLQKKIKQLEMELFSFQKGLHILEFQDKKILIEGFFKFEYREFGNNKLLILYIKPLTTKVYEQYVEHKFPEPLVVTFTQFKINDDRIEGVDLEGKSMKIYIDDKEQNLKTYYDYNEALSKVSDSDINIFINWNSSRALWQMEKIIYENCWSEKSLIN
jgi:hypothetical protein